VSEPIIRLLDDTSINKIAAGEVIDRPSSVVKELVENSLDAGAKRIEVEIEAGGVGKIRVTDDGCGMSEQDVRMSVLRHATSKIRSSDDLFSVTSMGFRGEALPSIASVSKFSLISRQSGNELGTRMEIIGGQVQDVLECGAEVGTVVLVTDLFFNTPPRLKFMKTASAESAHIHDVLIRLAISRPDVMIRLINNGRTSLQTPGTGRLSDTLSALYGPDTFAQLFPVDHSEGDIRITGFAARPSVRKGSRQWQSFTVNRRVIGSRMLNRAVDTAYQSLLPVGSYPLVSLHIEIASLQIDVNVHPQKAEVKFQDERALFRAVHAALKAVLMTPEHPAEAAAAFDHANYRPIYQPTYVQESLPALDEPRRTSDVNYWPLPGSGAGSAPFSSEVTEQVAKPIVTSPAADCFNCQPSESVAVDLPPTLPTAPRLTAISQFKQSYILASDGDCLYIVDQHAAHERILFDLLSSQQSPSAFQTLLIPDILDLDPLEVQAAESFSSELAGLGFIFDWVGPSSVRLSELPTHIPPKEAGALFRQILAAAQTYKIPDIETLRKLWIETAACHMAVRFGQNLNQQQMQGLLDDLHSTPRPYACPHGRPTLIRFTEQDLAKLFKRI
jgi:DNA mismatch repair protein MutL